MSKRPVESPARRGLMLDLARERRFHLDWTIELVRDLPRYGTNELHLYLENRFAFASLPGAYPDGSLTPHEARVLQDEAERVGVRVVPHLNVLGHNENLLRRVRFQHLRSEPRPQAGYQLNPQLAETRRLLAKQLADVVRAFRSPLIHVGGDETVALGELGRRYRRPPERLYLEHLLWVHRTLRRLRRRMGMWGDMLLHYPRLMGRVPRDVLIFDWHYGGSSPETLRQFRRHGFEVVPATSTMGWTGFLPGPKAIANQMQFLRDARRLGVPHHLSTCWEVMHGTLFSLEYAVSLPAQLAASGRRRPLRELIAADWSNAFAELSRLQSMESLVRAPGGRTAGLTRRAAAALGYTTHPFAFFQNYADLLHARRVRQRHREVLEWQQRAARLPAWRETGPLSAFADDLRFEGCMVEILLRRLTEWPELKGGFERGRPRRVSLILNRWERDYLFLAREFRRRESQEGYGAASRHRVQTARAYLSRWRPQIVREARRRTSDCLFETFLDSIVPVDWTPGMDRPIHPCDLGVGPADPDRH